MMGVNDGYDDDGGMAQIVVYKNQGRITNRQLRSQDSMKSSNCTKECRKGEKRSITGKTIHSNQDVIHAAEMQRNGPMPSQGLLRIKHRKNRQREVCRDEEIAHLPKGAISTVLI